MDGASGRGVEVEDLHRRVPAVAERLIQVQHTLADWVARLGMVAQTAEELVLAAYEAMANAVEHAYRDRAQGLLDLRASADWRRGVVTVTVTDYGSWRPPPADPGSRGRGLMLIRRLADRTEISPSPHGTTVIMTFPVA